MPSTICLLKQNSLKAHTQPNKKCIYLPRLHFHTFFFRAGCYTRSWGGVFFSRIRHTALANHSQELILLAVVRPIRRDAPACKAARRRHNITRVADNTLPPPPSVPACKQARPPMANGSALSRARSPKTADVLVPARFAPPLSQRPPPRSRPALRPCGLLRPP